MEIVKVYSIVMDDVFYKFNEVDALKIPTTIGSDDFHYFTDVDTIFPTHTLHGYRVDLKNEFNFLDKESAENRVKELNDELRNNAITEIEKLKRKYNI